MTLIIEQCFKLLDTFRLFGQDQAMLERGQAFQINGSIVIPYSVKMVNVPTFRQWLVVSFFPNNNMFKNVALFRGSRMFRFIDDYIAPTMFESTTLPMRTTLSSRSLIATRSTQFGCGLLGIPTIRARNRFFASPFPLLSEFMFSVFYAVLTAIFFSIHTLYYTILPKNMQTLAFQYDEEGTKFLNIIPYYDRED